jgi:hypothetical protein
MSEVLHDESGPSNGTDSNSNSTTNSDSTHTSSSHREEVVVEEDIEEEEEVGWDEIEHEEDTEVEVESGNEFEDIFESSEDEGGETSCSSVDDTSALLLWEEGQEEKNNDKEHQHKEHQPKEHQHEHRQEDQDQDHHRRLVITMRRRNDDKAVSVCIRRTVVRVPRSPPFLV